MQINVGKILTGLLTFFVAIIEILLGMRFVLKLLAASSNAEFTLMIYDTTESLIAPFDGVFPSFDAASFTLEISTFLAMIVYGIGGFVFIYLARNFEGMTVNPGSRPSGPPAITPSPQSPQPIQQPMQPVMQQPIQSLPPQPQPYQPVAQNPQYQPVIQTPEQLQPVQPTPQAPQTQPIPTVNPMQQPTEQTAPLTPSGSSPLTESSMHQPEQPNAFPSSDTVPTTNPQNPTSNTN